jgi:hypothetical protein
MNDNPIDIRRTPPLKTSGTAAPQCDAFEVYLFWHPPSSEGQSSDDQNYQHK